MVCNISFVTEKDLSELAALYQQLIPNDISLSRMKTVITRQQNNPDHIILVARVDGKLVGSLLAVNCEMVFGQCKSFMVVEDVIVNEAHRRKGIGGALMSYIENYARKNNCAYIMLITDTNRVGSQKFYNHLGYETEKYCAFKKHL